MFEIKGQVNTAICYSRITEDEAIEQIRKMCDYPLTSGSCVRIMPDVHAGKGCTVGTTMTVSDKACPNIVGVDIGCGMYTVKLNDRNLNFQKIDEVCHYIPSGLNVWEQAVEHFDFTRLRCYDALHNVTRLGCSLGTLGGGNHFIEVDVDARGNYYLVIHSGSRNLGKQVAEYYQKVAIEMHSNKAATLEERTALIQKLKNEGRSAEIQTKLKRFSKEHNELSTDVPKGLCWLTGDSLMDYLYDGEICQEFASQSREKMCSIILERTGMSSAESFHTIHNYIDTKEMILRKGAIAAHKGEQVLIPINMRDGAILAVGKGNPEWNYSAPHGAGRVMSRTTAKQSISIDDYRASMEGIYTTSINENTLDEAPMAYKSLADIIDVIRDSVDIIDIIKPVFNFKASEDSQTWKK